MPYSFVWLYLIKCAYTCLVFVDSNIKRFLSVLVVFGKYFVFTKNWKFQKQCCPVLATQSQVRQVTCHNREFTGQFWQYVRKWKVQSWGVHREFRGSTRDSLTGRPSSHEKHLENFSQFCLWVFWRLDLMTCWRLTPVAKNECLAKTGLVFKYFQFSLKLFMTIHFLSQLNLTQTLRVTLYKLHFCTFSPPNLQEKGMGSHFLTSYLMF